MLKRRAGMVFRGIGVTLVAVSVCFTAKAQKMDSVYRKVLRQLGNPEDSAFVEKIGDYLIVKLTQSSDVEGIGVAKPGERYALLPNISSITRVGFAYRFLSFGFKFTPRFLPANSDEASKGKTKASGFGFGLNFDRIQQDFSVGRTKGFYVDNSHGLFPNRPENEDYVTLPGFRIQSFQGTTAFKFNRRYSFQSVVTQSERQVKSAGSFMPSIFYRYFTTRDLNNDSTGERTQNLETLLNAGYFHTFVFKRDFYAALGVNPGFGLIRNRSSTLSPSGKIIEKHTNPIFRLEGHAGVGYNAKRFTAGLYTTFSSAAYRQGKTTAVNEETRFFYQFFLAYRFDAPLFLRHKVDRAEAEMNRAKNKARRKAQDLF